MAEREAGLGAILQPLARLPMTALIRSSILARPVVWEAEAGLCRLRTVGGLALARFVAPRLRQDPPVTLELQGPAEAPPEQRRRRGSDAEPVALSLSRAGLRVEYRDLVETVPLT